MTTALAGAMKSCRRGDEADLLMISQWLGTDPPCAAPLGRQRQERTRARVCFQQLSAPTAAKSVEDTASIATDGCYPVTRLALTRRNSPVSAADFHAACAARLDAFPRALLATATHDHKRGEDLRARLAVISEWPQAWMAFVDTIDTTQPPIGVDAADRWMLLQMLVGGWPTALDHDNEAGVVSFRDRIAGWQQKALREAKLRTDWRTPDPQYEATCRADLDALLAPGPALATIAAFAGRLMLPGAINALSQTFLRLTTPGIPDFYQSALLWDETLVDPDNRRPPDFARLEAKSGQPIITPADLRSGAIKYLMCKHVLHYRRQQPGIFAKGDYIPVEVRGPRADHVVAFLRVHGRHALLAAAIRLPGSLIGDTCAPVIPAGIWNETTLALPSLASALPGNVREILTGRHLPRITVQSLFAQLPVALCRSADNSVASVCARSPYVTADLAFRVPTGTFVSGVARPGRSSGREILRNSPGSPLLQRRTLALCQTGSPDLAVGRPRRLLHADEYFSPLQNSLSRSCGRPSSSQRR